MQALQSKQQFNAIWFGSVFIAMASAKANEDDSRQKEKFTGESWSRVFPHNGQVQTWKSFFFCLFKSFSSRFEQCESFVLPRGGFEIAPNEIALLQQLQHDH